MSSGSRHHAVPSQHLRLSSRAFSLRALRLAAGDGGDVVGGVAARSLAVSLARGTAWTFTDAADAALLAVDDGCVVFSADMHNGHATVGRRVVLATGQAGTLLAPPLPGERVEAITACRFTAISFESLRTLVAVPAVAEAIALGLARELDERRASIRNCSYVRHSDRVREKLFQLARAYGHVVPGGVRIDFPLTHQLIAEMVGSARETVSLAINELVREGLVRRESRLYVLRIASQELLPADDDEEISAAR
ncbi:MAG: family transcriptional regulator, cyclic receptor protein [Gaiellaceae bacterium]|nr:family transcriptional regulator, cyclic receptor protein [Gaiellaceae bacterium]